MKRGTFIPLYFTIQKSVTISSEQSKTVLESIVDYLINKQEEQEQSY